MNTKKPSLSVLPSLSSEHQQLIDQLIAGYQKPTDIIGENGLLKQITKAVFEAGSTGARKYGQVLQNGIAQDLLASRRRVSRQNAQLPVACQRNMSRNHCIEQGEIYHAKLLRLDIAMRCSRCLNVLCNVRRVWPSL